MFHTFVFSHGFVANDSSGKKQKPDTYASLMVIVTLFVFVFVSLVVQNTEMLEGQPTLDRVGRR